MKVGRENGILKVSVRDSLWCGEPALGLTMQEPGFQALERKHLCVQ